MTFPKFRQGNDWLTAGLLIYAACYLGFFFWSATTLFPEELRTLFLKWGDPIFFLATAGCTLLILHKNFDWKTIGIVTFFILLGSGIAQFLGAQTGYPFGRMMYTERLGIRLFNLLPWIVPFFWLILILNIYTICSIVILKMEREFSTDAQLLLITITAVIVTLAESNLEPAFTNVKEYWFWLEQDRMYYNVPAFNFFGWFIVSFLLAGLIKDYLKPQQLTTSTAWFSFALLASFQLVFAVMNWQAAQFASVMISLNITGLLAIALTYISVK